MCRKLGFESAWWSRTWVVRMCTSRRVGCPGNRSWAGRANGGSMQLRCCGGVGFGTLGIVPTGSAGLCRHMYHYSVCVQAAYLPGRHVCKRSSGSSDVGVGADRSWCLQCFPCILSAVERNVLWIPCELFLLFRLCRRNLRRSGPGNHE